MGWLFTDKDNFKQDKKEFVLKHIINQNKYDILLLEFLSNECYVVVKEKEINEILVDHFLYQNNNLEFGYKFIGVDSSNSQTASEKFYKYCLQVKEPSQYLIEFIKKYPVFLEQKKLKQNLKVGDKIQFVNASYNKPLNYVWQVTYKNGKTVHFDGYNLVGWRNYIIKKMED